MTRGANRALKGARGATPTRRVELQQVPECVLGKELAPRVIAYAGRIGWWVTKRGQSFVFGGCLRNRRRKGGNSQALCSLSLSLFSFPVINQSIVRGGEGEERKGGLPAVGVSSRVSQPTGGLRSGPAGRGRHGYTAAIELPQPTKLGRGGERIDGEGAALQSLLDSGTLGPVDVAYSIPSFVSIGELATTPTLLQAPFATGQQKLRGG